MEKEAQGHEVAKALAEKLCAGEEEEEYDIDQG